LKVCVVIENYKTRVFSNIHKAVEVIREEKKKNNIEELGCDEEIKNNEVIKVWLCYENSTCYFEVIEVE